jgi:hypothetical protein
VRFGATHPGTSHAERNRRITVETYIDQSLSSSVNDNSVVFRVASNGGTEYDYCIDCL